jgi:hypothetical protein
MGTTFATKEGRDGGEKETGGEALAFGGGANDGSGGESSDSGMAALADGATSGGGRNGFDGGGGGGGLEAQPAARPEATEKSLEAVAAPLGELLPALPEN